MLLVPVILCGGAGSRLWPVSRSNHPKPFIRLPDGLSLLQKAFLRACNLPNVADILVVTNQELGFLAEKELQTVKSETCRISYLLEPFGRNTAPAIAAASLFVESRFGPDATLLVLAADHLIDSDIDFQASVSRAREAAQLSRIVTFGIKPSRPATEYGYIEADPTTGRVERFIEKPESAKARDLYDSGKYYWNSGMFCFSASAILQEMQQHCSAIIEAMELCLANPTSQDESKTTLSANAYEKIEDISIDYAVMEKSQNIFMVPGSFGWSDLGSWDELGGLINADQGGNRVQGQVLLHDVSNSYIHAGDNRLIGAVGVNNLIVVDTPDALLVVDRSRTQDVKQIYNTLKALGHDSHKAHQTVHRPWGTYTVLEEGVGYKIKRLVVNPGASLSLQMHHHRSEHWVVVSGEAKVTNGEKILSLSTNQSVFIPAGQKHRLENPGAGNLIVIEVQSGVYFGEDDIVRFEDRYQRA